MTRISHLAAGQQGLSEEQLRQLDIAAESARRFRRVISTAKFNGTSALVIGVLSGMWAAAQLLTSTIDWPNWFVTAVLFTVGIIELRGSESARRLNVPGVRLMVWEQLGFLAAIALYCLYAGYNMKSAPLSNDVSQLLDMMGDKQTEQLARNGGVMFYAAVFLLSIPLVGGSAYFYHRRANMMETFLRETPDWVVAILKRSSRM